MPLQCCSRVLRCALSVHLCALLCLTVREQVQLRSLTSGITTSKARTAVLSVALDFFEHQVRTPAFPWGCHGHTLDCVL